MKYYLKYKDEHVLMFDTNSYSIRIFNDNLLPLSIRNMPVSYDMYKRVCNLVV